MFRRSFFGAGPWDGVRARPTAQLAGPRRKLGQGGNGCIIPGTEQRPVFDSNYNGTGACGVTWMDTSNAEYPECVQAPPGYPGAPAGGQWIPPSCATAAPPPAPEPTPTPEPEPPPSAPPPSTPPPSYYDSFPVTSGQCPPPGQPDATQDIGSGCCTPDRYERDPYNVEATCLRRQDCYDYAGQRTGSSANQVEDSLCDAPPATPVETAPQAPASPPPPPPAVAPTEGSQVPIAPGPFPGLQPPAPIPTAMPGPTPTPARSLGPSMRPACRTVPYKRPQFPSTTYPARADQFPNRQY